MQGRGQRTAPPAAGDLNRCSLEHGKLLFRQAYSLLARQLLTILRG